MKSINLTVYTGKELQSFIALLNQHEQNGLTDIRFVREKIQKHIDERFVKDKVLTATAKKQQKHEKMPLCPSCGKGRLEPVMNYEGEKIMGCKKCRYSIIK